MSLGKFLILSFLFLTVGGCASNPPIVPLIRSGVYQKAQPTEKTKRALMKTQLRD